MAEQETQTDADRARDVLLEIAESENELPHVRIAAAEALLKWERPTGLGA